jgi:hypothetical protein
MFFAFYNKVSCLMFSAYYYWQNRYVEFKPVIPVCDISK